MTTRTPGGPESVKVDPQIEPGGRSDSFLALVPLSDWWEKDRDILLLGPWCSSYERREELARLKWRMLPSPWGNRQRLRTATEYADAVYDRLLLQLTERLNTACGVQESVAQWRLLIGPWLLHFVHAVYDRYIHLSDALLRAPAIRTAVLAERCFRTPRTTGEAQVWMTQDDHFNWQLFSELLAYMDEGTARSSRAVCNADPTPTPLSGPRTSSLRRYVSRAGAHAWRIIPGSRGAWLTEITASRLSLIALAVRSRFQVVPAPIGDDLGDLSFEPIWDDRRSSLGSVSTVDDFEAVCARILPRHLPTIYLEGYHHARSMVRRRYRRLPSLLVSETGWHTNETYKYLAAEAVSRGVRLVTVQHGGYYGLLRSMQHETFERAISHAYGVWGWADGQLPLRNLPHPVVSRHPRRPRVRSGRILFVPNVAERYLIRLGSTAAGSLWEPQWRWQERFVAALPSSLRQRVALRPPPVDAELGQNVRRKLKDRYPEIAVDLCASFKKSVASSRLTVLERPGTCLLESFAMNDPTVLFWDPTLWDFRDEAVPYIDALRRAGILWDSPESAATHVAAVYGDPVDWWNNESVQLARGAFAERFALARRDWAGSWVRTLRQELMSSTKEVSNRKVNQDSA